MSIRNCSVQSFFKWDIILSRWQISLTKRGQCCYFQKEGGTEGLSDYCSEWGSELLNEWASEWVVEWRARADNMLTDWQREATVISIDPATQTPSFGQWVFSTGLQATARCWIITLHDCISGQIFLSDTTQSVGFWTITQYSSNLQWLFFPLK